MSGGDESSGSALSPRVLALMTTPQYEIDPRLPSMGLGFMLGTEGDNRIFGHDGGWPGFSSAMWLARRSRIGVLVFTNTGDARSTLSLAGTLMRIATGAPERPLPRPDVMERPFVWPELCGKYRPRK